MLQSLAITPGLGKTHLAIGLGVKAAQAGNSVLFDTASNWITRLATAHHAGQLETELKGTISLTVFPAVSISRFQLPGIGR